MSQEDLLSRAWTDHLSACASCRETSRMLSALRLEAEALISNANVPTPRVILLKGRLRTLSSAEHRLSRPLALMESLMTYVVPFVLLGLILVVPSLRSAHWILIVSMACTTLLVLGMQVRALRILRLPRA
jgi:hypothetical protein